MSDTPEQVNPDLHEMIALFAIAYELKYGTVDQLLTLVAGKEYSSGEKTLEDQIKQIDEQIRQLRGQAAQIEEKARAMEELLPGLMAAVGSDTDTGCSDSDPRKAEFFRLWEDPMIVIEDWLRLSQSYSEKEKASFVERMMSRMEKYDLSQLGFSDLYPHATL